MALPGKLRVPLWPFMGFCNSKPRTAIDLRQFTGASLNWLIGKNGLLRRAGSAIFGDTLTAGVEVNGTLESKWTAYARRMKAHTLSGVTDGYPVPITLYVNETTKRATIGYRSTNGSGSWRTVGKDFSATTYPDSGLVYHRVLPMVYRNQYGGMTLHRLNTVTDREHMAGGSRDFTLAGSHVIWPGGTSMPGEWDGGVSDGASPSAYNVGPLGLVPPLQIPAITKGNDLTTTVGPWKGSEAFFYTFIGETEDGQLGMFAIPRPPGSAWSGYAGLGYMLVDSANPTHYFDSLIWTVPVLPAIYKWVHLVRGLKADTTATAPQFPAIDSLAFCGRVLNGTTTYTDPNGNDSSLTVDPRIQEMFKNTGGGGGLAWPPCGRYMGQFDGHYTAGYLAPNPAALILAPWENGERNRKIDDAALYGASTYHYCVTPTQVILRKNTTIASPAVIAGSAKNASTVIGVANTTSLVVGLVVTDSGAKVPASTLVTSVDPLVVPSCVTHSNTTLDVPDSTLLRAGQGVTGTGIPAATTVQSITDATHIVLSQAATASATITATFQQVTLSAAATGDANPDTFTFSSYQDDSTYDINLHTLRSLCDAVNADTSLTSTVIAACTWSTGSLPDFIKAAAGFAGVGVGDLVVSPAFASNTRVTWIGTVVGVPAVKVDHYASRDSQSPSESVTFNRQTGSSRIRWAAQAVPGADADCALDNLLRTRITASATWNNTLKKVTLVTPSDGTYIVPGMKIDNNASGKFTLPTTVTAVDTTTGVVTLDTVPISANGGGSEAVIFYYDTGDKTTGAAQGYVRMFANSFPAVAYFSPAYLDQFSASKQASIFTAGSPGYAQNGAETWFVSNRRDGNAVFGPLMGFADFGPVQMEFHARGTMNLWNPRTGTTHIDADYTKVAASWSRGARSPYAICSGNGWAIFLSDDGFFARGLTSRDAQMVGWGFGVSEALISLDLYDATRPAGERGELEYAIGRCIAASEADNDDYVISAQVHGSVLFVRYYASSASTGFDREIRYDFSASVGRTGLAEVLRDSGGPYAWSTPLPLRSACSCELTNGTGFHRYAALNTNGGTADGRVDEVDTGTTDNGTAILATGYSGVMTSDELTQRMVLAVRALFRKAGTGLSIGINQSPDVGETNVEWDDFAFPSSSANDYATVRQLTAGSVRLKRQSEQYRIQDDGTGPCTEVFRATVDTEPQEAVN